MSRGFTHAKFAKQRYVGYVLVLALSYYMYILRTMNCSSPFSWYDSTSLHCQRRYDINTFSILLFSK